MTEPDRSNNGFRRITRMRSPAKVRLLGFIVVVVIGTVLVSWLTRTTWNQLERLQREHAAVKSESFYLGVTLRSSIRSLNSKLLQYGLSHDATTRDAFFKESRTPDIDVFENVRFWAQEAARIA